MSKRNAAHEFLFKQLTTGFQNQNEPKQPRNLRCNERLSYSVEMAWDKPNSVENDIQRYEMKYKIKDEKQWYTANTQDNSNSLLVQGLRSRTEYEFKVRAIFEDSVEGPFSDTCRHVVTRQSILDDILPDAEKIKDGQPAIYKIPLQRNDKSVNHKSKTRKCIFGKRGIHTIREKTILVVGATGSGKSTLIDGMVNYLLGVNWEDKCRFTVMDEDKGKKSEQSQSQTDWITCYTMHVPDTRKTNYILNIIDTPGFGDTRGIQRDQATVDQIKDFLTMPPPKGIETLDAVCFVTQAPMARLTPHQTYIFDSILSMFGKDISKNIFVLITFADGTDPPVIKALEAAKVPFKYTFEFNNSALFASTERPEKVPFGPMFWNMGKESFRVFFDELDKTETKSLQLTADVLNARKKLETTLQGLLRQMKEGLHVINTIKQEKIIIDQHMADIEANKDFEFEVEEIHQRKVDLAAGEYTTNCLTCNRTCHYSCTIPNNDNKRDCSAMDISGYCTSCPKRCIWSHHVNNPYRFEFYPKKVTKAFEDLKIKYEIARDKERQHSIFIQKVKVQFNQVFGNVFSLIKQARNCNIELSQKALKDNPLIPVEYIELFIEAEKREVKYGWHKRVEMLKAFKRYADLLKELPNLEFKPWTDEELDVMLQESDYEKDPVIPVEILRMDDKSLQLYKNALRDGKEKIYNIRVMVVGQFGVGKTTLTKRLLGKPVYITERKSTEGIDVYKHCCKISLDTGKWIVQHEDSDQLSRLQRLMKLLSGPDQKSDVSQEQEGNREVVYERDTTPEADNTQMSEAASSSRSDQEDQLSYSQPSKLTAIKKDGGHGMAHSDQETSTVTVTKSEAGFSNKERKDAVIEILHLTNENADKLEKDIVKYAALSIWDFAGQYAFYTTHQTFLSSRALYLLVIDLNQQITDLIKDDKCFLDIEGIKLCKVHDLVEIWMNSIHTCASSPEASIPHVVLVGTHVDKLSEKSRKEVIDKYFKELRYILKDKPTIRHLMDDIAIDNTQSDPMLEILKRKIFVLASQQPHWGEERPARWLPLEQKITTLKASGAKVVARSLIEEINMSGSVRIEDSDELDLFLIFHHEMGTILYFSVEGFWEKIVLDPQWLIDALKSLITAETFIKKYPATTSKWYEFEETGKLTHELIDAIWTEKNNQEFRDNKDHILLLMEKLNIIARPRSFTEDGNIKESNYFLAPCMLQQKAPAEVICPKPNDQMGSSSVLCFVFIGNFMPSPIFHRLLAACVAHWPIAINNKEEKQENQIFCGCCVFELDQLHNLTLHFKEFIIFVRVTKMGIKDKTPSSKLCIEAREFINTNLLKIIGYLGQSLKFEHFIQCPEYSGESVNSLIPVSQLKEDAEVRCKLHNNVIESCNLLKFWFEDKKQTGDVEPSSAVPMPSGGGDTDRFMRLTYLLVDVGSRILRQLLSHHTVTVTCTLDQYLAKNRGTINSLLKRKVLHQSQMDILFPPNGGNTNLEDYDVTLLSALFNNIVPSLTQQEEGMIKSLREDRNKLYGHAKSCKMNAMEYQTCWNSISSTLITLSQQCGDPNFQNEISQEIQRIQVSAIPTGSYMDILKTWFNTIETVKGSLETAEGAIQALTSRVEALELKKTVADSEGK